MREKYVAGVAVAVAGVAVAVGLVFASAGGVFDDSDTYVRPPAIDSSDAVGVAVTETVTSSSPVISVPPSPTWQVARETSPKPPFQEPSGATTTEPTTASSPSTRRTAAPVTPRTTRTTTTRPGG